MMLEIKGLRMRSSSGVKAVLMDVFGLKHQEIVSADCRNGYVYLRVINDKIQDRILCKNGLKSRDYHSKVCIRKVRESMNDHDEKYSETLFKINRIPIHWNVNDVVKYFQVSCNAPLRTCYRLNQDKEHDRASTQYAFVEFINVESAQKARIILERNRNCLGIIRIPRHNIAKILQYYPSYTAPKPSVHKRYSTDIDNNGGSRAFGTCFIERKDRYRDNKMNKSRSNMHNNLRCSGSSLNGHRIKRKLNETQKTQIKRSYIKRKRDKQRNKKRHLHAHAHAHMVHKRNRNGNANKNKNKQTIVSSESDYSSYSEYSCGASCCSSCLITDDNDHKEREEGEIEMKKTRKLRHIASKSLRTELERMRPRITRNKQMIKMKKEKDTLMPNNDNDIPSVIPSIDPSLSASPSIASIDSKSNTGSPVKMERINIAFADDLSLLNDKLIIFGFDICSAADIKEITKKMERSAQYMHAATVSDHEILTVWNNIISFFTRFPRHYVLHLDYVSALILSLIKYHSYLIPLSLFLQLPIDCLLELCSGSSIVVIEEFLNIPSQRFHQQFQNILIRNIDVIVCHNAGADLMKVSFRKLCKASLYDITRVIDKKNYKQLSKELIPIIRNRQKSQNQNKQQTFNDIVQSKTINSMTTNIILNSASAHPSSSAQSISMIPPPPPPRKDFMVNGLPSLEFETEWKNSKNSKKHKLNHMQYPPRKKQKIKSIKAMDPRLRRDDDDTDMNAKVIIKHVQDCVEQMMESYTEAQLETMSKNVLATIRSLSESFRNQYSFEAYLVPYFDAKNNGSNVNHFNCFDIQFYQQIFEIMQIVFKISDKVYSIVEIKGNNKDILHTLRSVCDEETVLFIKKDDDNKMYTFCVCSERLGVIQIDSPQRKDTNSDNFSNIFEALISIDDEDDHNEYDDACMDHFRCLYDVWKSKGVYREVVPTTPNVSNIALNDNWVNAFYAYLYLILDICRIDHENIKNQYLNDLSNISWSVWCHSLPIRVLSYLFQDIKQLDKMNAFL